MPLRRRRTSTSGRLRTLQQWLCAHKSCVQPPTSRRASAGACAHATGRGSGAAASRGASQYDSNDIVVIAAVVSNHRRVYGVALENLQRSRSELHAQNDIMQIKLRARLCQREVRHTQHAGARNDVVRHRIKKTK